MNSKSALRVTAMKVLVMVSTCLKLSSTSGAKTLSPISPYASLLTTTMWHFSW